MTDTASIRLRPIPGAPWLTQHPGLGFSLVSIKGLIPKAAEGHPVCVEGVYLNGVPRHHQVIDADTVKVWPCLREQGDYLDIRCAVPVKAKTREARTSGHHPRIPSTPPTKCSDHGYGFQRSPWATPTRVNTST